MSCNQDTLLNIPTTSLRPANKYISFFPYLNYNLYGHKLQIIIILPDSEFWDKSGDTVRNLEVNDLVLVKTGVSMVSQAFSAFICHVPFVSVLADGASPR